MVEIIIVDKDISGFHNLLCTGSHDEAKWRLLCCESECMIPYEVATSMDLTHTSKRPLRPLIAMVPGAFFMALWPDSLEPSWWELSQPIGPQGRRKGTGGHFSHWPQGHFYGL